MYIYVIPCVIRAQAQHASFANVLAFNLVFLWKRWVIANNISAFK